MLMAFVGFLFAPLVLLLTFSGVVIAMSEGALETVGDPFFLFVVLYATLLAYAWVLFLGLPVFLALRHFRRRNFWHYVIAGPVSALPFYFVFADAILEETQLLLAPIVLAPALVFAIVWSIAIRARVENV